MSRPGPVQSLQPFDFYAGAVDLWQHRLEAERGLLASVSPAPDAAWPTLMRNGIGLPCFEFEYHRIAFAAFEQHHREGPVACAKWIGKWCQWQKIDAAHFDGIFDQFPRSLANVEYQAHRLRDVLVACRDAERHLAIARRAVTDALDRHTAGYTIQTRGAGGYSGTTNTIARTRPQVRAAS